MHLNRLYTDIKGPLTSMESMINHRQIVEVCDGCWKELQERMGEAIKKKIEALREEEMQYRSNC
jgi:hypothetical protein